MCLEFDECSTKMTAKLMNVVLKLTVILMNIRIKFCYIDELMPCTLTVKFLMHLLTLN